MDLLVHSSLKRLGTIDGGAEAVLDALLACIGPRGTLVLPTHTWWTVTDKQPVFHVRHSPSCVGVLTEVFRKRPGVLRSLHPTHSVAAVGPRAEQYTAGQLEATSPCPPDSAYGKLCDNDGAILLLGVTMMHNTTLHMVEELAGLPGLYQDTPRDYIVIDQNGGEHTLRIRPHDDQYREYKYWLDLEIPMYETGILQFGRTGRGCSRLIHAKAFRDETLRILREDPPLLYKSGPWEQESTPEN
jgi:aminoglycoside 3-N-acetyltransferase